MVIQSWTNVTIATFQNLWQGFLNFIPSLVGALVVFIVGWFIANGVGKLIDRILVKLKWNLIFENRGWKEALEKAEIKVEPTKFIGAIIKWILIIVFLLAAVEILGFTQFAGFLKDILLYLGNVFIAVLIFVVTLVIVDIVDKLVKVALERISIGYTQVVSLIVRWSIWIFAGLVILDQLKIGRPFMEYLFMGIIGIIVITFGIAFGLGGKDLAKEILENLKNRIKEK